MLNSNPKLDPVKGFWVWTGTKEGISREHVFLTRTVMIHFVLGMHKSVKVRPRSMKAFAANPNLDLFGIFRQQNHLWRDHERLHSASHPSVKASQISSGNPVATTTCTHNVRAIPYKSLSVFDTAVGPLDHFKITYNGAKMTNLKDGRIYIDV